MEFTLESGLAVLERTPRVLREMLQGLGPEWLDANEGPDTWNPAQVVAHLIHADRTDWIPRASVIMALGRDRRFPPFDRFAHLREPARPLAERLDEFATVRAESLATLAAWRLGDAELALTGQHPEFGDVTLRQLLATWVAHDLGHQAQIVRVMARRYGTAVGPWRAYLSIMGPGPGSGPG